MKDQQPVRVFVGSGEMSLLERKTLIYSIRKSTRRDLDIWVYNGTHNAIERNDEKPYLAPLSLDLKYRNLITEFGLYRFIIPQLCGYQGRAIYLDADMICLGDIGELFDTPLEGNDFLALREAYPGAGGALWGLSVLLMDCETCRFDLDQIYREIDRGDYTYYDFSRMSSTFLKQHSYRIGELDSNWNSFDRCDPDTRLIHYTKMSTQPWRYTNHPYGGLWMRYFREAMQAGALSEEEAILTRRRGYVRRSILDGNSTLEIAWARAKRGLKKAMSRSSSSTKPTPTA